MVDVAVAVSSCPVPNTTTVEEKPAERGHESQCTYCRENNKDDYTEFLFGIHNFLRGFWNGTTTLDSIRILPKNKKATKPKPDRLFLRRNRDS